MCKSLRAIEIIKIADQQWASTKDIQLLGVIGVNKALQIKNEKRKKQLARGDNLPTKKYVSMQEVIKYFNIEVEFLKNIILEGDNN